MSFPEWIGQITQPGEHHENGYLVSFSYDAEKTNLIGFEPPNTENEQFAKSIN